jgi:hypothetical protein
MGARAVAQMFHALHDNGLSRLDAALLTAMQVVLHAIIADQAGPEQQ